MGKHSYEKSIPEIFLHSAKEDRIELLRGLLDTDGSIKPNGSDITYTTTSEELSKDISELVQSLGGLTSISEYDYTSREQEFRENIIKSNRKVYVVYIKFYSDDINPFYLTRKSERFVVKKYPKYNTKIKSIDYIGKSEVQCVKIDHPSQLYLTDNFIPTHNSMEQKMEPFVMSYMWNIDKICGPDSSNTLLTKKLIEILPLAYIRGLSIDNSIVIIDEAQNIDNHTFKSIVTRIGDQSKYILLGDTEQIDRKKKNDSCLQQVLDIFAEDELIGTMIFTDEDCVRNPIIPKVLNKLRENGI